jgi:hypothetical protein
MAFFEITLINLFNIAAKANSNFRLNYQLTLVISMKHFLL